MGAMATTDQRIIIAGTITLPPERRTECLQASAPIQRATRDDEPGCLAYAFCPDPVADDTIVVYELWENAEVMTAHFQHPNYWAMREMFAQFGITGSDTRKHRIDATARVYNAERIATASFDD
jgi:quinol monooxygenase YgiN